MKPPIMTSGGFRIPEFGKKNGLTAIRARDTNLLVRCLNALGQMTVARGAENAFVYADGNVKLTLKNLSESAAETASSGIRRAYIQVLHNNYVEADLWDSETSGFLSSLRVPVAKPQELRHYSSTTIYGVSVTYTTVDTNSRTAASGGFDNENHKVIMPYAVGWEILVADLGSSAGVTTDSGGAITYVDMNVAGRTWASVPAIPIP